MIDRSQWRKRRVARDPGEANTGDIARLLADAGLGPEPARAVLATAFDRRITARTMWVWCQRFGAEGLATAITAGMGHGEMLAHLISGTTPDFADLRVLAELAS